MNENNKKEDFLGTLDANLLGNLLTGKGGIATSQERGTIRAGKGNLELVKVLLEQVRSFNAAASFTTNFEI